MKRQISAGVIIFYKARRGREYLLLKDGYGHWSFPKGLIDHTESALEAARREAKEETNLTKLTFISGFKESQQYIFNFEGDLVSKSVVWYIAQTQNKKVKLSEEHVDSQWCLLQSALRLIDIKDNQELLKKAGSFLAIPRLL